MDIPKEGRAVLKHIKKVVSRDIGIRNMTIKEIKAIPATCKVLKTSDALAVMVLWG